MKTIEKIKGLKVYEFYFMNSEKIHFAISNSKNTVSEFYNISLKNVYVRKDIKVDEDMKWADVITGKKEHGFFEVPKTLEFYL